MEVETRYFLSSSVDSKVLLPTSAYFPLYDLAIMANLGGID